MSDGDGGDCGDVGDDWCDVPGGASLDSGIFHRRRDGRTRGPDVGAALGGPWAPATPEPHPLTQVGATTWLAGVAVIAAAIVAGVLVLG